MKLRIALISAATSVACAAGVLAGGQAGAAPAPQYKVTAASKSVQFTTSIGSLRTARDGLQVVDARGRVTATLPLTVPVHGVMTPVKAAVNGRTATLTPQAFGRINANTYFTDPPRTRKQRDDQALNTLGDNLGVATGVGALVGTIIGAGLGCILLAGLPPVPILTGCATGGGIGGTLGTVIAGGPVLIGNINEYFKTINSPFVPPKRTAPAPR